MAEFKYEHISKQEFQEFLDVLKQVCIKAYNEESADNFHDLYSYWNNIASQRGGRNRFFYKLNSNKSKLK